MGLPELLEGCGEGEVARFREGVDFVEQAEAARLMAAEHPRRVAGAPGWALLALTALRELAMFEWSGSLPGGLPYSRQPGWKVELWEAYWWGRSRGMARSSLAI